MKILKTILHFHGLEYTLKLAEQFEDLIIIDAMGDIPKDIKNRVIKIENKGFPINWNNAINILWKDDWDFIWISNNDIIIDKPYTFFSNISDSLLRDSLIKIITPCFDYDTGHEDYEECKCDSNSNYTIVNKSIEFTSPIISREIFIICGFFPETKYGFCIDNLFVHYCKKLGFKVAVENRSKIDHLCGLSANIVYKNNNDKDNYFHNGVEECFKFIKPMIYDIKTIDLINDFIYYRDYKSYLQLQNDDIINNVKCEEKDIILYKSSNDINKIYDIIYINTNNLKVVNYIYNNISKLLNEGGIIINYNILKEHIKFVDNCNKLKYLHYSLTDDNGIGIVDSKFKKEYKIYTPTDKSKMINYLPYYLNTTIHKKIPFK